MDLIEKETRMKDAECEYWDEYITNTDNPVRLGPDLAKLGIKPGFAQKYLPLLKELDRDVLEYLCNQVAASHKTGMQVINDLIREKLAVTV